MNFNSAKKMWRKRLLEWTPGQLVVQITDRCNARCPQCSMRVSQKFLRHSLTQNDIFRIIDSAAQRHIKAISFTGGEPFLSPAPLFEYLRYAGEKKIPFIRTGTNGYFLANSRKPGFKNRVGRIARQLSKTRVRNFWISLDSCDASVHDRMRGFDDIFEGVYKALPVFEDAGIYPSANLGINRNLGGHLTSRLDRRDFCDEKTYENAVYTAFAAAFSKFYSRVADLGFTIVNACYPMSIDADDRDLSPVYQASAADRIVRFSSGEKRMIFKALNDTIPKFRDRIRIFTPRTALHALTRSYEDPSYRPYACQGGVNYFFIDSVAGDTFPCGYRGNENFGKIWKRGGLPEETDLECRKCDWECFRDPSELMGPVIDLFSCPVSLIEKSIRDATRLRLWTRDLLYYRACDFFNGRKAPDYRKMRRFKG